MKVILLEDVKGVGKKDQIVMRRMATRATSCSPRSWRWKRLPAR